MIPIRCDLSDWLSFGQFATELVCELSKSQKVEVYPVRFDYLGEPPLEVKPFRNPWPRQDSSPELYIHPIYGAQLQTWRPTAFFTMWETTKLPSQCVGDLNQCRVVIVPNAMNAACFSAQGVQAPIRIVPLGIKTEAFNFAGPEMFQTFSIGAAAGTFKSGSRKGLDVVLEAFRIAFTKGEEVKLRIKSIDPVSLGAISASDTRIDVTSGFLSQPELATWYSSLHVFASGCPFEGWGRMQQEAMTAGAPVIGVNFGGVCEFFHPDNGYPVNYTLGRSSGHYHGHGDWPIISVNSMAEQMQRAYAGGAELSRKSETARSSALGFTISKTAAALTQVLNEYSIVY